MTRLAVRPFPGAYCILVFAFDVGVWVFAVYGFFCITFHSQAYWTGEQIIGESFMVVSCVIVMSASAICIFQ
jgi:hypothetical protein